MTVTLSSGTYEVEDAFAANELFQRNGWTDGLPIIPPTEALVRRFLDAGQCAPDAIVGIEPVRRRHITAEKVAIAAVMAGCLPEYMPTVLAIIRAMCVPQYNLHGSTSSTGGCAPMIIVNGPLRVALGMHATHNALGNGSRANASIGRTLRLFILNVLGGHPGQLDRATLGHPGKFSYCVAEDEEDNPWLPLSAERGVPAGASAVTVFAAGAPHQILNEWTHDPKELLDTYAAAIRANMLTYSIWHGNYALVIARQQRDIFVRAGWSKADIRDCMFENCWVKRKEWRGVGKAAVAGRKDEEQVYRPCIAPEDLLVIAAGGTAGGFGAVIPPWIGNKSMAVTIAVTT
ncbi:MAG: hypothetical protein ACKVQQ_01400 [Burkholderiales bacterium]